MTSDPRQIKADIFQFVDNKSYEYRIRGSELQLRICPECQNDHWNFEINLDAGQYSCWACRETNPLGEGHFYELRKRITGEEVPAKKNGSSKATKSYIGIDRIKDAHEDLLANKHGALDYLKERGILPDTIRHFMLAVAEKHGKNCLVLPYLSRRYNTIQLIKYRSLPPAPKAFFREAGMPSVLFNADFLQEDKDKSEIIVCGAEIDTISVWQAGRKNVVGASVGESSKGKAFPDEWVEELSKYEKVIMLYDGDDRGSQSAIEMRKRLGEDRVYIVELPEGKDANKILVEEGAEALVGYIDKASPAPIDGIETITEVVDQLMTDVAMGIEIDFGYTWCFESITERFGKKGPGNLIGIAGMPMSGKAQPLHSKIMKQNNEYVTFEDVSIGDEILNERGSTSKVVGVFDRGILDVYEVITSDGRRVFCCEDHIWLTKARGCSAYTEKTTGAILKSLKVGRNKRNNHRLPDVKTNNNGKSEHDISPYAIGAIIGDGSITPGNCRITSMDEDIISEFSRGIHSGDDVRISKKEGSIAFDVSVKKKNQGTEKSNTVKKLIELGLYGKSSSEKFIPLEYKNSPYEDRLSLLRGICDTDGSVSKRGAVDFSTASMRLAEDIREVVLSLGGYCSKIKENDSSYTKNGITVNCKKRYRFRFSLYENNPFLLTRKAEKYNRLNKSKLRSGVYIKSVLYVGKMKCRCISTSNPSGIYLTDDYVPTHNSTLCIDDIIWQTSPDNPQQIPGLFCCLEMNRKKTARKIVQNIMSVRKDEINMDVLVESRKIIADRPLHIEYHDSYNVRLENVLDNMEKAYRRFGVKYVVVDNLHILSRANAKNDKQELLEQGRISRELKMWAESREAVVLLVIHVKKMEEGSFGGMNAWRGSAAISADVDAGFTIYREYIGPKNMNEIKNMDMGAQYSANGVLTLDKVRDNDDSFGRIWLHLEGQYSRWRECVEEDFE